MSLIAEIATIKAKIDKELEMRLQAYEALPEIKEAIGYSLLNGGKRLRPALMLKTAEMLECDEKRVLGLACAIEMIHTYSLVHDDLPSLDNDTLRRGKPTSHVVYGEANAILIGDALLNLAMETAMNSCPETHLMAYNSAVLFLFKCSGIYGMIGGQWLDLKHTGIFQDEQALQDMHLKKTGALFLAACLCPAISMGMTDNALSNIKIYAKELGLLFQITDDILDVTGNEVMLGKSTGKDTVDGKSTYVNLLGLEKSKQIAKECAARAQKSLESYKDRASFHSMLVDYVLNREK